MPGSNSLNEKAIFSRLFHSLSLSSLFMFARECFHPVPYELRYHHISNAGVEEPNEPLNSIKVLIGLSKNMVREETWTDTAISDGLKIISCLADGILSRELVPGLLAK